MSIRAIDQTIRHMCTEFSAELPHASVWEELTEAELLYEVAVCVCGSQMLFELAIAIADRLRNLELLEPEAVAGGLDALEARLADALALPVNVTLQNGIQKSLRPRFKNRLPALLASTMHGIYGQSRSIRCVLRQARDARDAREILIRSVFGFGPKQASLFLRRIGYCADLAVLDVHVLDYLLLARGLTIAPSRLRRLTAYEEVETVFRDVASDFGHPVGLVDLATWLTMRVAKREAIL